jgi:hypothetical protein
MDNKSMKLCPHCRLPLRTPGEAIAATDDGVPFVFVVCLACAMRLRKLPTGTRHRHLNTASDNVVRDPEKYPHRAFGSEIEARLFVWLASDPVTAPGVVAELLG